MPQKKVVKVWKARNYQQNKQQEEKETPSNKQTNESTDNDKWTMVGKSMNDKVKNIMDESTEKPSIAHVRCHNGFTPLSILSDPIVVLDELS